jgi:outer membrane immunogenic protein
MSACRGLLRPVFAAALWVLVFAGGAAANGPPRSGSAFDGLYVGGSIGGAWGESGWVYTTGGFPTTPNPFDIDGLVGGLHVGYQRQFGKLTAGIETSVMFSDNLGGSALCPNPVFICSTSTDWVWMLGPRLGYAMGNMQVYGTGGYALGRMRSTSVDTTGVLATDLGGGRHDGWYLGGGVEWAIAPSLVFGVEYRRIELSDDVHFSSLAPAGARAIDASIDTIQARLSLKLGQ